MTVSQECYRLYSRFDDRGQSTPPLPVQEPVHQVARHLGCAGVEAEEADVVSLSPGLSQVNHVTDALIILLLWCQSCQSCGQIC